MASTFSPNIQLEEPGRGDQVGVWDTPVNANMSVIDLTIGGIATQALNNSNVILSAAQFRSKGITFNSTLTGSFPDLVVQAGSLTVTPAPASSGGTLTIRWTDQNTGVGPTTTSWTWSGSPRGPHR